MNFNHKKPTLQLWFLMVSDCMITERPRARALRLLHDIVARQSSAGLPLPPERELAEQCAVSRTALRWALARLTEEGSLRSGGARTRMVADAPTRLAITTDAVYLFSSVTDGAPTRSGGWGEFVHIGALQGMRNAGRTVLIPGMGIPDEATVAALLRQRPIGVLIPEAMITGVSDQRLVHAAEAFAGAGIPTVVFGEEPATCDRIASDHEGGAYALSRWLVDRGCRRQLCLWATGQAVQAWRDLRRAGHERALSEVGCPLLPVEWMRWREGEDAFDEQVIALAGHLAPYLLAAEPIDSVMAMTDGHVPAICAALRRCGREPGRDITVVGYDAYWHETETRARCPIPPAATVDKRNRELGLAMAALLEERIAGTLPAAPQLRLLAPNLIPL